MVNEGVLEWKGNVYANAGRDENFSIQVEASQRIDVGEIGGGACVSADQELQKSMKAAMVLTMSHGR